MPPLPAPSARCLYWCVQVKTGQVLNIFQGCEKGGLVFRPLFTRIACGNGMDSGGTCHAEVPPCDVRDPADTSPGDNIPGDKCVSKEGKPSWLPKDCGTLLARVTKWQRKTEQPFYNEFILEADDWQAGLPQNIEAVFGAPDVYRAFMEHYNLRPAEYPLLTLEARSWREPFKQVLPRTAPHQQLVRGNSRLPFGGAG